MPTAEEIAGGTQKQRKRARSGTEQGGNGRLGKALGTAGTSSEMAWDEVDPRYIAWIIINATRVGGAATFGRSRDGGALMVTILLDGDRVTRWIAPHDDCEQALQKIAEQLDTLL